MRPRSGTHFYALKGGENMGNNIKGITIEIGGSTGPLTSALKDVNKTAGNLQSELREVNKQLKFDPQNVVLSTQKIDLLKEKSEALAEKQKTLKTSVEQFKKEVESGDYGKKQIESVKNALEKVNEQIKNSSGNTKNLIEKQKDLTNQLSKLEEQASKGTLGADKVRAVEREYEKVNSQLKETKKDLAVAEAESGNFTEKVKGKFSLLKDKIKDTFSAENVKAGIGAVGVAVGGFLKSSLDEAKDAQKANADLEQTLKSTKGASGMTMDSLNDLTQAMMNNTAFTDDEIKSGEGMLLTFTNIGKNVFPQATAALLDMSQKMGTDTKTQAVQLGKALNDPLKGVTALTKVGVTFTDQQKKQIETMEKAGDTAGAQKVILSELNKEFGGQASAAAETYDGKQKQVANTMKEIKETIGTALMPALAALLKPITPIIQAIANFVQKNPQLTAAILAVIAVVGTLIGGMQLLTVVTSFLGIAADASLAPILPVILAVTAAVVGLSAIAIAVVTHWKQVSGFFIGLWNTIKGLFSGIGQWFKSVFSVGVNGIKSAWSSITGFYSGIWNGIKSGASAAWNGIKAAFSAAVNGVKSAWSGITGFFSGIWDGLKSGVIAAGNGIKTAATAVWNGIRTAVMAVITPFISGVVSIWNSMKGGIQTAMNGLKNILGGIWTAIKNVVMLPVLLICDLVTGNFGKLGSDIAHIFTNVRNGLAQIWAGIQQVFLGAVQAIGSFLSLEWQSIVNIATSVWNAFSSFMANLWNGICSTASNVWNGLIGFFSGLPARIGEIMNSIGNWIRGVWNGLTGFISSTVVGAWNGLVGFFSGLPAKIGGIMNSVGSWIRGVWDGLTGFIGSIPGRFASGLSGIGNAVRGAFNGAISFIKNLPGEALHWGSDIIDGIVNGIKGAVDHVRDAVSGVANNIRSFLHFSVPDEGPLADFESWMPDFMGGLAKGIRKSMDPVLSAAKRVAAGIASNLQIPQSVTADLQLKTATVAIGGAQTTSRSGTANDKGAAQNNARIPVFQQTVNNYSPKALTPAETSRQLRNATRQFVLALQKG